MAGKLVLRIISCGQTTKFAGGLAEAEPRPHEPKVCHNHSPGSHLFVVRHAGMLKVCLVCEHPFVASRVVDHFHFVHVFFLPSSSGFSSRMYSWYCIFFPLGDGQCIGDDCQSPLGCVRNATRLRRKRIRYDSTRFGNRHGTECSKYYMPAPD